MTVAAWIAFVLKIAPTILSIIEKVVADAHDRKMIESGRLQEIADATQTLNKRIAIAVDAAQQQEAKSRADSTDTAFPRDMWRD